MTDWTRTFIIFAVLGVLGAAFWLNTTLDQSNGTRKALSERKEQEAITFCLDHGGVVRFDYVHDEFKLASCSATRGQERP